MMWLTLSRQLKLSLPIWGRVRAKRGGGAYLTSSNLTRSYPFICTTIGCSWVP